MVHIFRKKKNNTATSFLFIFAAGFLVVLLALAIVGIPQKQHAAGRIGGFSCPQYVREPCGTTVTHATTVLSTSSEKEAQTITEYINSHYGLPPDLDVSSAGTIESLLLDGCHALTVDCDDELSCSPPPECVPHGMVSYGFERQDPICTASYLRAASGKFHVTIRCSQQCDVYELQGCQESPDESLDFPEY